MPARKLPGGPAGFGLAVCLTLASAQDRAAALLPSSQSITHAVALEGWTGGYYYLDIDQSEVLYAGHDGKLLARYGGWGGGAQGLDYPVDLVAAENSVWVLDQGAASLVRLDSRLNLVARIALPEGSFPIAFTRDRQQRFWVARDGQPGLQIIDDSGQIVQTVGDGMAGGGIIQRPVFLATGRRAVKVWDAHSNELIEINYSGHIVSRQALALESEVIDLAAMGPVTLLLTSNAVWRLEGTQLERFSGNSNGWLALVTQGRQLLVLGTDRLDVLPIGR